MTVTSSGEHAGFPGTLSFGNAVVESMIVELVRSADWSSGVVLVNGHGGNADRGAPRGRDADGRAAQGAGVVAAPPRRSTRTPGTPRRRCMLAIAPELVRRDRAVPGRTEHVTELIDELRAGGMRAVSPNGVLGDPHGATAAHGRSLLTRLTIDLVAAVDEWRG